MDRCHIESISMYLSHTMLITPVAANTSVEMWRPMVDPLLRQV